ncbi:MAG: tetratricopeptide repeat protein [Planctomycetes bacterium]|nr:tetratricopeptide repeat protein [Planctomycetota bacterium]
MRHRVAFALGLLVTAVLGSAPALRAQGGEPKRETFEELLARARAQREALQSKLGGEVKDRVTRLEPGDRNARPADVERAVLDVVALGGEAVPLLVPYLDPGAQAAEREVQRARRVALALLRMDTSAATDALLAGLASYGPEGQKNVLRVLETSKEPERVKPRVSELFRASQGELRGAALRALFALGAAGDAGFVKEVLLGPDVELTRLALRALADGRQASLLDATETLMADAKRAGPLLGELLDYLKAVSGSLREKDLLALARLATLSELDVERRVAVLVALPELVDKLSPELKKPLERASEARDRKVKEAAYVARVCLGDKAARKELMLEYDDRIKKNDRWAPAWGERAEILFRIRDYDAAVKDYNTAISIGKNDPTPRPDYFVGLAKSYAMLGKLKDAADWLERAPITIEELKALAGDPAFAKLREHSKYGGVFGTK